MLAETAKFVTELSLSDKMSPGLKKASGNLSKLGKQFGGVGAEAKRGLGVAAGNIARLGTVAAGGLAAIAVASAKEAGNFEAALNTINTVARVSASELGTIGEGMRKLARDTGASLDDLTTGYYDLVSAGIDAADAQNVLTQANTLAIGGLATNAETVDLLTTAINTYGGDASKAAQFTDEFAKAIERGKVTAADLAASYAHVGPLAASLNIENAELAAGYARLTANGTGAAEAATQMASAMTALLKTTPGLEKLQKTTGKNYAAIAGSKGLNVALEQMRKDAKDAGIELIDLVGRKEALLYILQTTGPNMEAYNADLAAMGDAAGTAAGQMAERQQGLNFQLDRLRANARDAAISIGSELLPKLTPLAAKLNDFLGQESTRKAIGEFGAGLASALEEVASIVQKVPWEQVGKSLEIAGLGARAVVTAFTALPPWVQTAVLTGWGLNKLTGGALSGIVGELGKGLIKGVLGMNAGVVNLNAAVVKTSGLPIGGKGGGGGALPTAGKVGAAGALGSAGAVLSVGAAAAAAAIVLYDVIPNAFRNGGQAPTTTTITPANASRAGEAVWNTIAQNTNRTLGATNKVAENVTGMSADIRNGFTVGRTELRNGFTVSASKADGVKSATVAAKAAIVAGDQRTAARIGSLDAATKSGLSNVAGAARGTTSAIDRKSVV